MPLQSDEDEEFSGSVDNDDGFEEDMEALRKACLLTGTTLNDLKSRNDDIAVVRRESNSYATSTSPSAIASGIDDGDLDDSEEEDLELLRKVRSRFLESVDSWEALSLKPLCVLPPALDDDVENADYETLCAVRRRFAAYDKSGDLWGGAVVGEADMAALVADPCTGNELVGEIERSSSEDCKVLELSQQNCAGFPKSAQVIVDAIKRNRSCQKFLGNRLAQIEARMEENNRLKERVKILKDFQVRCQRVSGHAFSQEKDPRIQLISAQRTLTSKDSKLNDKTPSAKYNGPLENSHVANYRLALSHFPVSWKQNSWTEVGRENLAKGLRQQFQEMVLQVSLDRSSESESSLGDADNLDGIVASIRDMDITPERIREFIPKVNWDQLASLYVPGHSGAECESRWLNFEDPLINHGPWTRQEEKKLLLSIQEKGLTNWVDIAASLGTNRTPFDCLAHFQRSLNINILKQEWTEDEDNQLRAAVKIYGESNWQAVASTLVGRTGTQCSNRWLKSLHPHRSRKGRWTMDEDKRLKVAVKLFGPKNWEKIAQFVPGRTQVQCRERWVNSLDPSLNWDEWTEEEDMRLKSGIEEFGYRWSKIAAKYLPQRTDNQCTRRWKVLFPHEVLSLQAARRTKKAALISNFVDREEDRPALGPDDFIPLPMIAAASDPRKRIQAKKHKAKSRELDRATAKQKDAAPEAAAGNALKKLRPKRPIRKVQIPPKVASELIIGDVDVENVGRTNNMPADDGDAQTYHVPNILSLDMYTHDSTLLQTKTDNGEEVSVVHLITCGTVDFEEQVQEVVTSLDCATEAGVTTLESSAIEEQASEAVTSQDCFTEADDIPLKSLLHKPKKKCPLLPGSGADSKCHTKKGAISSTIKESSGLDVENCSRGSKVEQRREVIGIHDKDSQNDLQNDDVPLANLISYNRKRKRRTPVQTNGI